MSAKRKKSNSYSENANVGLTIFDAPNVCRQIVGKCESLAKQIEDAQGEEIHPDIANEIRGIGDDARRMLDAIVASVDQILAADAA